MGKKRKSHDAIKTETKKNKVASAEETEVKEDRKRDKKAKEKK